MPTQPRQHQHRPTRAPRAWGKQDLRKVPYDQTHFEDAIRDHKHYACGDNFFKLDMAYTASGTVPVHASCVDRLVQHHFQGPAPPPLPCVVPVRIGEKNLVELPCMSPIEMCMAILRAVARDVKAKDADKVFVSCRFVNVELDSTEDVWKYARQLREDISQNHVALRLSALQTIYEFVHFRRTSTFNRKSNHDIILACQTT